MKPYLLALDQGTTSSRCILFDRSGNAVSQVNREFRQSYPRDGWVEQDATEILASQMGVAVEALLRAGVSAAEVAAIGITNQRETVVVWDRATGKPICPAIVWQCRRTAAFCEDLKRQGLEPMLHEKTGLIADPYFSATKLKWILDNIPDARRRAEKGELYFGTVDSWLIWNLSGGKVHATDPSNAARTMLFNIHTMTWDPELLELFGIPAAMLPEVRPSSGVFGVTSEHLFGEQIPIAGVAGDQQAALFGQTCFAAGDAKNTYGTGCFLLMNTGTTACESKNGLLTTIGIQISGETQYALEGSVFVGGAVIQWLRDEMRFFSESRDAEYYAGKVKDTGGVYLVPAFTGLGAPHWDMYARGCLIGLTRGTTREHIIRAAQESIAYQVNDLLTAMKRDTGVSLSSLSVDGGASRDSFLMQFQSDISDCTIRRPVIRETTALGACYLAGLATGVWHSREDLKQLWRCDTLYAPSMDENKRRKLLSGWDKAVGRSLDWAEH